MKVLNLFRLSKLSHALAAKGYNVTSLSADLDAEPIPNLHFLHLDAVYDHLHNSSDRSLDFFAIGQGNSFKQLFFDVDYLACEGAVKSNGWNHLLNYPNEFKVEYSRHFVSS